MSARAALAAAEPPSPQTLRRRAPEHLATTGPTERPLRCRPMTNSPSIGGRVFAVLGSTAALITIGGLGHCVGVESSRARIEELQGEKNALEARIAELPEQNSDVEAALKQCSGQLATCQQDRDRFKSQWQATAKAPSTPTMPPVTSGEPQDPGEADDSKGPQLVARLGNVEYRLHSVEHTGQELQVWLVGTNTGANLETAIYFQSSVTDPSGDSHQQSARMAGGKRGGLDWLWVTLPHQVPTRFGLAFDSVPPPVERIPYMRIRMRDQGWLEFRDVPVPYSLQH